ncbi:MAG: alkaline phosphatase family protein [Terriglobia bacterium]
MRSNLLRTGRLAGSVAVLFFLGFCSLLPQAAWCASATRSLLSAPGQTVQAAQGEVPAAAQGIKHVLLITIDGAHAFDILDYIKSHPQSALAKLNSTGVFYKNAYSSMPSDSFPATMAIITGGGPVISGIWYQLSYYRNLSPPGSDCSKTGTPVALDSSIDINPNETWGGGGFDKAKLPRNPKDGCSPVYPHQLLRVNTIFDVIKQAGMYTAFSDKQMSMDLEQGRTGHAIDDFFSPESSVHYSGIPGKKAFDAWRTKAVVNWISGKNATGTKSAPVPAIMGVSFEVVDDGEKAAGAGWTNSSGTPSAVLTQTLDDDDANIGKIVDALNSADLLQSTAIIIGSRHGQSPVDIGGLRKISPKVMDDAVNAVSPGLVAFSTGDDIYLYWLTDQSKTAEAVKALEGVRKQAGIARIFWGSTLSAMWDSPKTDPETPDIIVEPDLGVIYTRPNKPIVSEHGGLNLDDTHVFILVSNPRLQARTMETHVQNAQLAPTIVKLLGLDPNALEAVRINGTEVLPGLF